MDSDWLSMFLSARKNLSDCVSAPLWCGLCYSLIFRTISLSLSLSL